METRRPTHLTRRSFLASTVLAAGALALPGGRTLVAASHAAGGNKTLRVGLLRPASTLYPALADSLQQSVALGLQQATGWATTLLTTDGAFGPDGAQRGVQGLLAEGVDLVLGMVNEDVIASLHPLLAQYGVPLLACNLGANRVPPSDMTPLCLYHTLGYWQAAHAVGGWAAATLGPRAFMAASFYDSGYDTPYAFQMGVEGVGGSLVGSGVSHVRPDTDGLAELLARIAATQPDLVFALYTGQPGLDFFRAYADAGLLGHVPLVGSAGFVDETLLAAHGDAALGIPSVAGWTWEASDNPFTRRFEQATGRAADVGAWLGYSAAQRVVGALQEAGEASGEPFRVALAKTETAPTLYLREVQAGKAGLVNAVVGTLPAPALAPEALLGPDQPRTGWLNAYLGA